MTEEQETIATLDVITTALDEKCGEFEERNVYSALMNLGLDILKDEQLPWLQATSH
jgi:hypothetical protein